MSQSNNTSEFFVSNSYVQPIRVANSASDTIKFLNEQNYILREENEKLMREKHFARDMRQLAFFIIGGFLLGFFGVILLFKAFT